MQIVIRLNSHFKLDLHTEDARNIAFYLVNGQFEHSDTSQTLLAMRMLKDIFNIIQYHAQATIHTDSNMHFFYSTHIFWTVKPQLREYAFTPTGSGSPSHSSGCIDSKRVSKKYAKS